LKPRLSANLGFLWPDRPLPRRIEAAARAGFRGIELHFPFDVPAKEVAALVRRHDLTLLGINTPVGSRERGDCGLGAVPGREAEFHAAMDEAIAYCSASGARAIHVLAGNVASREHSRARVVFAENLRAAAPKAAEQGLTLLLEPLNTRDSPGYFYSTLAEAVALIEELALPNLKLQFDVYHVAISEGDVLMKLQRYLPLIGNVQIAAVPTRAEPDEGEISYPAVFTVLEGLGYQGWVGCEYRPRGDTDEGLRWRTAFKTI
jgi:hydroxypyruvate isomerase